MRENITAFFTLYVRPVAAISRILDHGRLWFAIVAAIGVSFLLHIPSSPILEQATRAAVPAHAQAAPAKPGADEGREDGPESPSPLSVIERAGESWIGGGVSSLFSPLIEIALVFVPVVIFIRAISGYGSFSVLMRSDYTSMLMCGLMAWAAAYLPAAIVLTAMLGRTQVGWLLFIPVYIVANLYFAFLAAMGIRTMLGTGFGQAIGLAIAGCFIAVVGVGLSDFAGSLRYYAMSPFLLYYGYMMFGSDVRSLGEGLRGRQHLQQQLQFATNNPRDADAHYQLGLVYQKRRQFTEASVRFRKAIEIDPTESEATFQLGKIAREQGRFDEAIKYLSAAAAMNDKLASSEVWRELGSAYFGAGRLEEAAAALAKYTDRRSYDPEGLYWYGKSLAGLQKATQAKEAFTACVEAVETMPKHRRAEVRKWKGLAKKEL